MSPTQLWHELSIKPVFNAVLLPGFNINLPQITPIVKGKNKDKE